MKRPSHELQLALTALLLALFAGAALMLMLLARERAEAHSPHPDLNFALGVDINHDGTNDCGTGVPSAVGDGAPDPVAPEVTGQTCTLPDVGGPFTAYVYLMNAGGIEYAGATGNINYQGVTSKGRGDAVWAGCAFEFAATGAGFENVGCTIGLPPAPSHTDLGLLATFTFTCTSSGSLELGTREAETSLTDPGLHLHHEGGIDRVLINCGIPTPAPTDTPGGPSPTPTSTPSATNTPPPSPTPTITPTPPSLRRQRSR